MSCFLKFASKHSAEPSFCLKLARIVRKLKVVRNSVRKNFLLEIGVETLCAKKLKLVQNTVRNCPVAKTCGKHRAQLACCSKLSSKHSAHLSFCSKLAHIVRKPKPVKNVGHNFRVARNSPQITLRNCRFASNWPVLLGS